MSQKSGQYPQLDQILPFSADEDFVETDEQDNDADAEEEEEEEEEEDDFELDAEQAEGVVRTAYSILSKNADNEKVRKAVNLYNLQQTKLIQRESQMSKPRRFCFRLMNFSYFSNFILLIVVLNLVMIILQTIPSLNLSGKWYFTVCDQVCLSIYIVEAFIKIYGLGGDYFQDGWNLLDFGIILVSLVDYITAALPTTSNFNSSVIRAIRVFRSFRAIRAVRFLRESKIYVLLQSVYKSFPSCFASVALLLIMMYFFGFIGYTYFKDISPQFFGNFGNAFFSMFQLCTLDNWFDMFDTVKEITWWTIIFFIGFILLCSFIIMNYITAVLTDNACDAAIVQSNISDWINRMMKHDRSLRENEELMKGNDSAITSKQQNELKNHFKYMSHSRLSKVSDVLALLGEIEKYQMITQGYHAMFAQLIDDALEFEAS